MFAVFSDGTDTPIPLRRKFTKPKRSKNEGNIYWIRNYGKPNG